VRDRIAPNGFSGRGSLRFRSAVWITELKGGGAQHIDDARGMRMHRLFFARLEMIFEDAHLVILEKDLVILR